MLFTMCECMASSSQVVKCFFFDSMKYMVWHVATFFFSFSIQNSSLFFTIFFVRYWLEYHFEYVEKVVQKNIVNCSVELETMEKQCAIP